VESLQEKDYVYFVHGIRTYGEWTRRFKDSLKANRSVESGSRNYGRFPLLRFLLPAPYLRDILDLMRNDLRLLRDRGYRITIVAHSFGAYLVYRLLRRDKFLTINRLVLCGAVIQRRARWVDIKYFDKQVKEEIVNLCGLRDPFPALAELACRRFGASGVVGAGDPSVEDRYYPIGHGGFFSDEFYTKYFQPAIFGEATEPVKGWGYPWYVRVPLYLCSRKAATKFLLGVATVCIVFIYYVRPEFACAVVRCYVDVYTIDDLRETHLENGMRKVRRSAQSDWKFNFMTNYYNARLRFGRGSGVTKPEVYELDAQHQRRVVSEIEDNSNKDYIAYRYPISVNNYHAVGFLVYNGDFPQVSGYSGEYLTRNLQIDIQTPQEVDLVPCEGESFSSGIEPRTYADPLRPLCVVSNVGHTLTCTNINLPARERINYYFRTRGWDSESDGKACTLGQK
jgi:hypothetical protein